MKIAVSACLLGHNCKYSGGNNRSQKVLHFIEGHEVIPVCPEVAGGLPIPRIPVELQNGRAINANGEDVTEFFQAGTEKTIARLAEEHIDLAILQPRSPSCGCKQIYDGTFTKILVDGKGMFAQALAEAGIPMMDATEIPEK
ncbi:MAG: DUF523 domain-containing protein [Bacteroidales bacterium]|nr:2-thiouracil desulfurase family protein [Anaerotignum sp.]MCI5680150.1 DUF523 domain-containing protein [Bacteroidales bacterium]MDY3927201.1 DUF523 domain-containing protein [Anaerotignum sp.]